jgi:hypothetical protein
MVFRKDLSSIDSIQDRVEPNKNCTRVCVFFLPIEVLIHFPVPSNSSNTHTDIRSQMQAIGPTNKKTKKKEMRARERREDHNKAQMTVHTAQLSRPSISRVIAVTCGIISDLIS